MYSEERLKEMFGKVFDSDWLDLYFAVCGQFKENPQNCDKFHHHHIYPSFLYKMKEGLKNRYHTVDELDKKHDPKDNVVKLPISMHVTAHYFLGMALRDNKDAVNSFYVLIDDYSVPIESYSMEEVQKLGMLIEENSKPSLVDRYLTQSERKEMMKATAKENKELWEEAHKEELEIKKAEMKERMKAWKEEWKETHKEEIAERKRKQKEYRDSLKKKK